MSGPGSGSWWVKPATCDECGETIGVEERIADIARLITETVDGKQITVCDPIHLLVHARHWTGGRRGWVLDKMWPSLGEALEWYGP